MDIGAYIQIDNLSKVMEENNISVPRLRGLRLMKDEKPISREQMEEEALYKGYDGCEQACCSGFVYDAAFSEFSSRTDKLRKKYLTYNENRMVNGIRWDKVHGRKRKLFKYIMKKARRRVFENSAVFNKYCGREDVLYIHARIGGGNWPYYHEEVDTKPWFLEKIDDSFDRSYCDIYAKITDPSPKGRDDNG